MRAQQLELSLDLTVRELVRAAFPECDRSRFAESAVRVSLRVQLAEARSRHLLGQRGLADI